MIILLKTTIVKVNHDSEKSLVYNKTMTIIEKIKKVREQRNITQKQMGFILGVAKETYRNIETGSIRLKLDDYLKICGYLDVAPSYFLNDYDENYVLVPKKSLTELQNFIDKLEIIKKAKPVAKTTFEDDLTLYLSDSSKDDK